MRRDKHGNTIEEGDWVSFDADKYTPDKGIYKGKYTVPEPEISPMIVYYAHGKKWRIQPSCLDGCDEYGCYEEGHRLDCEKLSYEEAMVLQLEK